MSLHFAFTIEDFIVEGLQLYILYLILQSMLYPSISISLPYAWKFSGSLVLEWVSCFILPEVAAESNSGL